MPFGENPPSNLWWMNGWKPSPGYQERTGNIPKVAASSELFEQKRADLLNRPEELSISSLGRIGSVDQFLLPHPRTEKSKLFVCRLRINGRQGWAISSYRMRGKNDGDSPTGEESRMKVLRRRKLLISKGGARKRWVVISPPTGEYLQSISSALRLTKGRGRNNQFLPPTPSRCCFREYDTGREDKEISHQRKREAWPLRLLHHHCWPQHLPTGHSNPKCPSFV